ncbi:MAG: carboxypeptidase-like regulatory domain-containing protein [Cyclobacteriaceae bacterium]
MVILIILSSLSKVHSQQYFSGKVTDYKETPIPYAHIQIEGLGTITNITGEFKLFLPEKIKSSTVTVSCIGYVSRTITLSKNFELIILTEDVKQLDEVTVISRDYAREIVENAIENIPYNYPNQKERYTGFFREMTMWGKDEPFKPIYVAEAVLESVKESYTRKEVKGSVKIIEGRIYESNDLDSLTGRFYSGPHEPFRFDIVAQRSECLGQPKSYSYYIVDTTRFNGKDVFKISFSKNNRHEGHIYVMDSTFAVVKAEFHYTEFPPLAPENRGRKSQDYVIDYYQGEDGKWRLKHTIYKTWFERRQSFSMMREYSTTDVSHNIEDIPYAERIQFADIFLDKTGKYDPEFWKNYNIITPDNRLESYFEQQSSRKKSLKYVRREKVKSFLSKLSLTYELVYFPLKVHDYSISYSNSQFNLNESGRAKLTSSTAIATGLQYKMKSNFSVGLKSISNISRNRVISFDLEFSKQINLNPAGRPLFFSPTILFGHQRANYFLQDIRSDNPFVVNGKQFDSGNTSVFLESKGYRVQPLISFGVEKNSRFRFIASFGYNLPLYQKDGLYFDEKDQFFLNQKRTFLENRDGGLTINGKGKYIENNISISFGIYLRFR